MPDAHLAFSSHLIYSRGLSIKSRTSPRNLCSCSHPKVVCAGHGSTSHRIGRRFFPRLGTIRWSSNRAFIASHPIPCTLHWLHPSWKAACPFEYRQQTAHTVQKCPWNLQSVFGSSVPGSPPHSTVSHCMAQRIVPSRLTCRGCSHGFSIFIPDLVVCPLVCHCRCTEHYGCK